MGDWWMYKPSIKFIYFDVGGVMLRWKGVLEKIAKKHNVDREKLTRAYLKYNVLSFKGKIKTQDLWKKAVEETGWRVRNYDELIKSAIQTFTPICETHDLVFELIKTHGVGLLTNIHQGNLDLSLEFGQVPKLKYSAVVESWKIGFMKPEKEIYLHAQKMANVSHENILFIDDMEENTKAAEKLGWQTVVFDTDNPKESVKIIKSKLK